MSITKDSKRLEKRLKAIPVEVVKGLEPALIKSANEVARNMNVLVPVAEGDLKASIAVTGPGQTTPAYAQGGGKRTAGPQQALVTVGDENARHGHLVEFGTVKMDAQPFMLPAWRLAKARVTRRISRAIGAAIKKAGLK